MRKTFLIAILCACCMILHAQNYATLTQTGVNTTISGSKSITTFQVDVADATVSLLTGTIDVRNIRSIMANQKKDKGYYQVSTTVPSSGVYTIGLIVNGCVYKKKIIIK